MNITNKYGYQVHRGGLRIPAEGREVSDAELQAIGKAALAELRADNGLVLSGRPARKAAEKSARKAKAGDRKPAKPAAAAKE